MARELVFIIKGSEYSLSPVRIERKKVYGWTETIALDDEGNECKLVSMDESGTVIIPKGGIGLGMICGDNKWVKKEELMAVDENGNAVNLLPASFSGKIELSDAVTAEEFLDYSIIAVYELDGEISTEFISDIKEKIYRFDFNYRDGYESRPAFIIESEGKVFMLVGVKNEFAFVGLEEAGYLDEGDDEEELSEELGIDFGMM